MKTRQKSRQFALIWFALILIFSLPLHAEQKNDIKSLPDATFKGELKTFRGHELGYVRPSEGDIFELDFNQLEQIEGSLKFPEMRYIPIPAPFKIQDVEGEGEDRFAHWESFRAISEGNGHRVILDAQRKPGRGDKDFVEIWIAIESRDRMTGFLEIHGKIYPNKSSDAD